jgi:flagellar hook-associated protein 3 FlgL
MRVATHTYSSSLVDHVSKLAQRQLRLQEEAASGQRIRRPEDDPAGVQRLFLHQDEVRSLRQYERNIGSTRDRAQATYSVLRELKKISDRAGELAVLADDTKSPEDLRSYAVEVSQLIKRAVQLGNTKWEGDYLFAGTQIDRSPFTASEDAAGNVTAVAYGGDTNIAQTEIAEGVTLSAQTVGANSTGAGPRGLLADTRFGADFFGHLISFQNHLLAADTTAIAATNRSQLATDEENLLVHFSANGVVQARLEATLTAGESRVQALEGLVSREADVDIAETLVRLSQTQTAYQAALQSGARLMSLSLLDFIR